MPAVIVPSLVKAARRAPRPSAWFAADALVAVELLEGRDLLGEPAVLGGGRRTGVRLRRERVLLLARDVEARVLGVRELAHPDVLDRAVEAVVDHHVDHRLVAERRGAAHVDGVRRAGHRVEAADQHAGRLALAQHPRRQPDRAEGGQADVVDGDAGHLALDPARERRAAARVLPARRLQHVAEDDVVGLQAGARSSAARTAAAPSSTPERAARAPRKRPIGVRAPATRTGVALSSRRPGYGA